MFSKNLQKKRLFDRMIFMRIELLEKKSAIIREIRSFFYNDDYLELFTPCLSSSVIPEPSMEYFTTSCLHPYQKEKNLYLLPSPEFWMKLFLAKSARNIFQIGPVFRNGEQIGPYHNPEFLMLEYYKMDTDYLGSITILEDLFRHLAQNLSITIPELPFPRASMESLFAQILNIKLSDYCASLQGLRDLSQELGMKYSSEDNMEQLFNRIFLNYIEEEIANQGPLIVMDYPACIPTLAKTKPDSPFAERWELYIKGIELANCYSEEESPEKIKAYFDSKGRPEQAYYPDLLKGFPRCSGTALGIERLILILTGKSRLAEVIFFNQSDIISNLF